MAQQLAQTGENKPIFKQIFDSKGQFKPSKKTLAKIGGALAFSAAYGAYEYNFLDDLGNNLKVDLSQGGTPVAQNLYPYHLTTLLPAMAGASLLLAWDTKDPLRTYLNFFQVFPSLAVLEDMMYFISRGLDPNNPDAGKYLPAPTDWTSLNTGGSIPIGDTGFSIPVWYFVGAGLAGTAWALDNVVFREKKKQSKK